MFCQHEGQQDAQHSGRLRRHITPALQCRIAPIAGPTRLMDPIPPSAKPTLCVVPPKALLLTCYCCMLWPQASRRPRVQNSLLPCAQTWVLAASRSRLRPQDQVCSGTTQSWANSLPTGECPQYLQPLGRAAMAPLGVEFKRVCRVTGAASGPQLTLGSPLLMRSKYITCMALPSPISTRAEWTRCVQPRRWGHAYGG